MATLPNAVPEANCADCSESRPLQVNQGLEDCSHQAKLLENKICIPELSSFQIRHFVSTVRGRDFSKCWPFRQEILEKCLSVGLKPFLPPFDPPPRGYDYVESEHEGPLSSFKQVLLKELDEFCEESREKDCTNGRTGDPAASTRKFIAADQELGDVIEAQLSVKQSDENHSEGTGMVEPLGTEKMLLRAAVNVALEKSQDESENDVGTGADTEFSGLLPTDQVGGTVDLLDHGRTEAHVPAHLETICTQIDDTPVEAKDSNFQSSGQFESECCSIRVIEADFSNHEDGAIAKVRQEHKGKFRLLSNECSIGPKQADFHNLKPSKIVISGKACQDNSQPLGERLNIPDQATVSCVEPELVGLPPRVEKSRNCEDSGFTGPNLDSLIPQVCPVCLNFTSTSNTALNAHIDHCLESVLPGDKGEARACKSKTKPRRMRSMVDICAAAPARTLEDLELSSRRWVLNDEVSTDDYSSCLGWRGGVVRRQPRTSLYRGPAWKGRSIQEGEDIPHVAGPSLEQKQQQPEMVKKKDPVAKAISQHKMLGSRSSTSAIDAEVELQESCKNQQIFLEEPCIPGPLRSSHVASSMHTGKPRMTRKKKKSGSLNLVSVQDIPSSGGCCQPDEEQADHSWSGPLDLLGFTPVDTSADEEKRLQQKLDCPQGQDSEVDMCEQQGSVEGFLNRPRKTFTKHSQNSDGSQSLVVTNGKYQTKVLSSDSKHLSEALMKRKLTQIDFDWILDSVDNSAVEEDIATEMHAERPLKNKRIAPKIKSLGTLVETPCKDKDKDGVGELGGLRKTRMNGLQEVTSDQEVSLIPTDGPSSYQGNSLKRKCLGGMKGNTKRGSCDRNKHARLCPSKRHLSSHNVDSYNSSEDLKSPKDSSYTLGRALTEHTAQGGMYSDSLAVCPVEEMPQCAFVKDFDYGNVTGERRASLMSRMYQDQTGGKIPRGAAEQRNIMHANTSKQNPLVQVPPCDSDQLRLVGNGTADCGSSFEALRKEFSNTTLEDTCLLSMEEALKERSNATSLNEQAVKINVSASPANKFAAQTFTGCNTIASVGCFATVNDLSLRDDDGQDRPQLLSTSQKPLFTEDLACFQSVDSLRTSQMAYDFAAAPEVPNSVARSENQNRLASLSFSWSENSQLLAAVPGIKMIKNNDQVLASAERLENMGISMLKPSTEHGIPHVSLSTSDLCERIGVNSNQSILNRQDVSILGRRNIFSANKSAHNRGRVSLTECLQRGIRAAQGTMDDNNILSQSLHDNRSSRILTSELGPVVVSPAPGVLSEDSHNLNHEGDALDYAPMLAMSTERMSLPSDLLADFARTMAGNSTRSQDSLPPKHCVMTDQQSTLNASLKRTPKDLHIGREYLNLMPLQGIANSSHTSVNGGNVQPHFLQTALQAMKGSTSTTITDRVNPMVGSIEVSGKLCNSSPNPRICGNLSSGRINGRRESLSGAELTSSLNGYRTVECSGDQGVVHIFGNPVFKLMGQNVIVTNNNIKSLGMESPVDQNGAQNFHPSNSIRHLGLLQETHSQYPQTLSQDIFSSSRLEAWHGDACKARNCSFMMDNLEIHPHAFKSLPSAKFGHMEPSVYKDTAIIKPPISVPIPGERSRVVSSTAEIHLKKQAFVNNVSKPPAEVSISDDSLPSSNASIPAILSRGRGIVTQQNGKPFTAANFLLSGNEPQLPSQTLTLQPTSSAYLADIHKLGVSGSSTLYGGSQRSGTLADIVQNSERSNS